MSETEPNTDGEFNRPPEELPVTTATISNLRDTTLSFLRGVEETPNQSGQLIRERKIALTDGRDMDISAYRFATDPDIYELSVTISTPQDSSYIDRSVTAPDDQIAYMTEYRIDKPSDMEEIELFKATRFNVDAAMPTHEQTMSSGPISERIRAREVSDLEEKDDQSVTEIEASQLLSLLRQHDPNNSA